MSSHSYSPLTSQEGSIIVDTEEVPGEQEPPSAEYLLCGQWGPISVPQTRSVAVIENWISMQSPMYMSVYISTFYCVPGAVLGKRVRKTKTKKHPDPLPQPRGYRVQQVFQTDVSTSVSVIPCQADRQAHKSGHG